MAGTLFVVGTPIGNLGDLTFRALEILKAADQIACEDTRQSLKLLNHYGIHKPLMTIFGPKERRESAKIIGMLGAGKNVALLTDAGTPGISDPGNFLVREARKNGCHVLPVPGVSALTCALSVFGAGDPGFIFLGFLPRRGARIRRELEEASKLERPIIFFESPFRVLDTLEEARKIFGAETRCWIGREMTKKFEEYLEGTLDQIMEIMKGKESRGEFTVALWPLAKGDLNG